MKKGDTVGVANGSGTYVCDGVVRSIDSENGFALVDVPSGNFGRRCTQAHRHVDDLQPPGGTEVKKAAKKKTSKKKAAKKKTAKKKTAKKKR